MRMNSITLQRMGGSWVADFRQADNGAEVERLFGSPVLLTPYRDTKPAADVQAEIARLNPGHQIIIRE